MEVPSFLKLQDNKLLFNLDDSEFVFYIDEAFFNDTTKTPIAEISGEYVTSIGICSWAIIDKNGRRSQVKLFKFPTMFMCRPYAIEKEKGLQLYPNSNPSDYRVLKFRKGDEVISQTRVPQILDNVEIFFKLAILSAKMPNSIPYDIGWNIFNENMELNGNSYKLSAQLFGILWSAICRDPDDITRPYRYTDCKSMTGYKPISIKMVPKYVSPYAAIVSEGWDEAVMSAIMLSDKKEEDIVKSPVEKVVTQ